MEKCGFMVNLICGGDYQIRHFQTRVTILNVVEWFILSIKIWRVLKDFIKNVFPLFPGKWIFELEGFKIINIQEAGVVGLLSLMETGSDCCHPITYEPF